VTDPFGAIEYQRKELLAERIAASLRTAIIEGLLRPGTRLAETDLAQRFGVSRVPLREAFRMLEGEGIVTIQPHRGVVISELSSEEMLELFQVREMIEATAAALLATRRDAAVLKGLTAMAADRRSAVESGDLDRYYRLVASFHDALVAGSGNRMLSRMYGLIRMRLRRYQMAMTAIPDSPAQSIAEHGRILRRIRAGKAEEAARLTRDHVRALVRRFQARDHPEAEPAKAPAAPAPGRAEPRRRAAAPANPNIARERSI